MLAKKKRVTKDLFPDILKNGRMLSDTFFVFRYILPVTTLSIPKMHERLQERQSRYAFVAPKSVAKRAVDRNALRRRGYRALATFTYKPAVGVFFYKKPAKEASYAEIKESIGFLLKKANLL